MMLSLIVAVFLTILSLAAVPAVAAPLKADTPVIMTDARILVPAPNVEVYEVRAGGQSVLKTEWTEAAREHVRAALEAELVERKAMVVTYRAPEAPDRLRAHLQILKVHSLVAQAVLRHAYGGRDAKLPSKAGRFDWSLGPGAHILGEDHEDARYVLFVTFIDGHASGGRVAMNLAAVIFGGTIVTFRQIGIASLVELRTGNVIWFNRHQEVESEGDLRTAEGAVQAVRGLLKEFPQ